MSRRTEGSTVGEDVHTSMRRRISLLGCFCGLLGQICFSWATGKAVKAGIYYATGNYVANVDCAVEPHQDAVLTMVKAFERDPELVAATEAIEIAPRDPREQVVMKWVRQHCQDEPANIVATAFFSPWCTWTSPVAPPRPRAANESRKGPARPSCAWPSRSPPSPWLLTRVTWWPLPCQPFLSLTLLPETLIINNLTALCNPI